MERIICKLLIISRNFLLFFDKGYTYGIFSVTEANVFNQIKRLYMAMENLFRKMHEMWKGDNMRTAKEYEEELMCVFSELKATKASHAAVCTVCESQAAHISELQQELATLKAKGDK